MRIMTFKYKNWNVVWFQATQHMKDRENSKYVKYHKLLVILASLITTLSYHSKVWGWKFLPVVVILDLEHNSLYLGALTTSLMLPIKPLIWKESKEGQTGLQEADSLELK